MRVSDLTDYPKIYRISYWGQGNAIAEELPQTIIENRNRFVREYDLKKSLNYDQRPNYLAQYIHNLSHGECCALFDHVEAYRASNDMIVIIASPYDPHPPTHLEFKSIYRLYNDMANTFVHITTRKDIQASNAYYRAQKLHWY